MKGDHGHNGASEQIKRIREEVEQAVNELNVEHLGNHFADDVAMIPEDGPRIVGVDAVKDFHRDLYGTVIEMDIEFTIENITVIGGVAVEEGTYQQKIVRSDEGESTQASGNYLYTYERGQDGSWEIHRLSWE